MRDLAPQSAYPPHRGGFRGACRQAPPSLDSLVDRLSRSRRRPLIGQADVGGLHDGPSFHGQDVQFTLVVVRRTAGLGAARSL